MLVALAVVAATLVVRLADVVVVALAVVDV